MSRKSVGALLAGAAATVVALTQAAPSDADPTLVFPGMEIRQGHSMCTLGYVDPIERIAFTAGHCRGDGPVTDRDGRPVGMMVAYADNVEDGASVGLEDEMDDFEVITLYDDVVASTILPGGRVLESVVREEVSPGEPVCHFGVTTGESCGTVDLVNNGWFTMGSGVVGDHGDSGGPVYVLDGDRAVIVGLLNSNWGASPAAVSWQATNRELAAALND